MKLPTPLAVVLVSACHSHAFSTSRPSTTCNHPHEVVGEGAINVHTRANFLKIIAVGVTGVALSSPNPVQAKSTESNLKGTKKDPAYEACVSKCMYECTKPKVDGQKTRQECLPECKQKCATTKEQLLLGAPKASSS